MYRLILIHPDHTRLQQILWRESPLEEFSVYQLSTLSYGTRTVPYLAICCIKQLAEDNSEKFPLVSKTILEDVYADDVLTGPNDLSKLKTRCNNIYSILQSASLTLTKWNSNCSEKRQTLHPKHTFSLLSHFLDDEGMLRVEGGLKITHLPFHSKHPILLASKHLHN
nr:unnamed protein product [Callosobruchus analis]